MSKFPSNKTAIIACLALALIPSLATAQPTKFEGNVLVGTRLYGSIGVEVPGSLASTKANVGNSISYGLSTGIRLEAEEGGYDIIGFRWLRQPTHLTITTEDPRAEDPIGVVPFRPSITLNHFMGDFVHEFALQSYPSIQPYVSGSLGVAVMSTPASSTARFAFGLGTGINVFPTRNWGLRLGFEYLPMLMHADVQRIVCINGCTVALKGGLMNQFQINIGPSFRF